jgi:DNA primase catalytic core
MAAPTLPPPEPAHADPARLLAAHEQAVQFYRRTLLRTDGPRRYLAGRGMAMLARPHLPWRTGVDRPWRVGYAPPGWTTLVDHLTTAGYTPTELQAAGLATRTRTDRLIDTFRDRIMLPIHDHTGRTVAFIGRAAPGASPDAPKYLNSPDSVIYHKGQILYGLAEQHDRLRAGWAPALVEGPLDTLAVWLTHPDSAGLGRVALAPCGTSLTPAQAATVAALPGARRHGVTVAFDDDTAGHTAADRAFHLLCAHSVALHSAQLPTGADPADLITHPDRIATLRAGLSYRTRSLAEVVIDHRITTLQARHPRLLMETPGQVAAVRAAAPILTRLPAAQAVRLVQYVAEATGTGIDTVTWAVLDVFDAWQPDPRIRSPVAAPSPHPQGTKPPATSTDAPAVMAGGARRAFLSPRGQASTSSTAGDHHPVPGVTGHHAGRSR